MTMLVKCHFSMMMVMMLMMGIVVLIASKIRS